MLKDFKKNDKNWPKKSKIKKYIYLAIFRKKHFFQLKVILHKLEKNPLIESQLIRIPKRNSAAGLLCYIEVTYWVTRAATTGCFASPPACLSGFPGTSEGIQGPSPKHR